MHQVVTKYNWFAEIRTLSIHLHILDKITKKEVKINTVSDIL